MTKYREILRLSSLGFSNRNIALSVPCSRNTVSKVLKRAKELNLSWPLSDDQTDAVLEQLYIQNYTTDQTVGCLIMITSEKNYSAMVSVKNFSGQNILKIAVQMEMNH